MTYAYDRLYLEKARVSLGRMLDFAVNQLHYDAEDFFRRFTESGIARKFEHGDSSTIAGRSGIENAYHVIEYTMEYDSELEDAMQIEIDCRTDRSPFYWAGWALAYYQWISGLEFTQISAHIPLSEIIEMYHPYHEMDIRQFCEQMNTLYRLRKKDTNLKIFRRQASMSQKELAEATGIPLRTIQQYEQRQKSINRASADKIITLAHILMCTPESLLEPEDA